MKNDVLITNSYNLQYEQELLKMMINYSEQVIQYIMENDIKSYILYDYYNRNIYKVILELYNNDIAVTYNNIRSTLKDTELNKTKLNEKIALLISDDIPVCNISNLEFLVKQLKKLYYIRYIHNISIDIAKKCNNGQSDINEIVNTLEENVIKILYDNKQENESKINDNDILNVLDTVNDIMNNNYDVVYSGFNELDNILFGFKKGEQTIIGARPSVGKTALALSIMEHVVFRQGKRVMFFSLEMGKDALLQRIMTMLSYIDGMKLQAGKLNEGDEGGLGDYDILSKVASLMYKVKDNMILEYKTPMSTSEIISKVRLENRKKPVDIVIIDYLQLIQEPNAEKAVQRNYEIGYITKELRNVIARKMNIPIIILAQLNRAVDGRKTKRPMLSDLRDSGEIEQHTDNVVFIHRDDYQNDNSDNKGFAELIVAKQRNGAIGKVNLAWIDKYTRYENIFG